MYLLVFPVTPWGLAGLIGLSTLLTTLLGRPEDSITAGITVAVVLVLATISPTNPWQQPILRLVDTCIGIGVGVAASWLRYPSGRWTVDHQAEGR
jgi:uncharacterized membrane protein YccC